MLQNATALKESAPGSPNISDEHVSCTAPATQNASLQILCKCHTRACQRFWNCHKTLTFCSLLTRCKSLAPAIWTSKSGPGPSAFKTFDLEMCFVPQRCALFPYLNFQMCSEHEVFCAVWLRNVLCATTACNFSPLIWPDGSAPAAVASLLFDPSEPQTIGKTQWLLAFLPFRPPASSFFWLFLLTLSSDSFSSLIFFLLLFSSLALPTSAFPSVHIVGSLTSKLPSRSLY